MILILNVLDLLTTYWAIHLGAHEGNPIVKFMLDSYAIIPLKLGVCALMLWTAFKRDVQDLRLLCVVWFVAGVYTLVVVLNSIHVVIKL